MIHFENPFWLWLGAAALVALLLLFRWDGAVRRRRLAEFASDRLVADLIRTYSNRRRLVKNAMVAGAFGLLFVGLARPQWGHSWKETSSRGIDIVFAVDCSRSMLATDIAPSRLMRARLAMEDFVNRLEGDRVGLVAFAGEAFLQCPLTLDYDAFFQTLDALEPGIVSAGGTDLAAAIEEAQVAFSKENNFRILVLVTDGEDLGGGGLDAARKAAEDGLTIYTIGVGTEEGAPIPVAGSRGGREYLRDADGQTVQSRLEPETLSAIAETTDGFYLPLGADGSGLEQVLQAGLGSIPREEISSELKRVPFERYQWALGIALVLLLLEPLLGTRRATPGGRLFRRIMPLLFLAAVLPGYEGTRAHAAEGGPGRDPRARKQYNQGYRDFEKGDFSKAAEAFTGALQNTAKPEWMADALYNLGNTRFRQGELALGEREPGAVSSEGAETRAANEPAISRGRQIVEGLKAGGVPPPQREQAAALLRERVETTGEAVDSIATMREAGTKAEGLWRKALEAFEGSLELAAEEEDAAYNRDFVARRLENLATERKRQKALQRQLREQREEMERLLKELEEAAGEDSPEQDQEQEQSSGEEQGEGGGDESETGGSGGDQAQSEGKPPEDPGESENRQANGDSGERGSEADRDLSEAERGSPREGEEEGGSSDSSGMAEDPSAEGEPTPDSGDGPPEQEETPRSDRGDEAPPAQNEAENGAETGESGVGDELAGEAEAAPGETASGGGAGSENRDEAPEKGARVIGVMTAEDAARLLDSMKDEERKLPVFGRGRGRTQPPPEGKDW